MGNAINSSSVLESLSPVGGTKIKHLSFSGRNILEKDLSFLYEMDSLEKFDFPTNLYTTEQVAWISANFPNLSGFAITPYTGYPSEDKSQDGGWIVGKRKPYLKYEGNEGKIEKYEKSFEELKKKYKGVSYKDTFGGH